MRKKLLLVDDEETALLSHKRQLSSYATKNGLTLVMSNSSLDALEILKREHEDVALIICDQKMPHLKGTELLLKVKSLYSDIVSIIVSGYGEVDELIDAVRVGVFSYVMKPCRKSHLVAEVDKAMGVVRLREQNREFVRTISNELQWAGDLQERLLEIDYPQSDRLSFSVSYQPLSVLHCGGDYYDVIDLGNDRFVALVGDVSGHGAKAAIVTAILKSIISAEYFEKFRTAEFEPGLFLDWLNRRICSELKNVPEIVVTFAACLLDLPNGLLSYANAGHPPVVLLRADSAIELNVEGSGMGLDEHMFYAEENVEIQKGDKIVLYTDGLVEAPRGTPTDTDLDFGGILVAHRGGANFNERVIEAVRGMLVDEDFSDDLTLVSIDI
jgi:phosphoserine phosphatase RsbU/P